MADSTKKVTVEVDADTSGFEKNMQKVHKWSKKFGVGANSPFNDNKAKKRRREQYKANRDQIKFAKNLVDQEKKFQNEIKKTTKLAKERNKELAKMGGRGGYGSRNYSATNRGRGNNELTRRERFDRARRNATKNVDVGKVIGRVMTSLASRLYGVMRSTITGGYDSYLSYGRAAGGLQGMGVNAFSHLDTSGTRHKLRGFGKSNAMGFTAVQSLGHMRQVGRLTGDASLRNAQFAQRYARAYGGDVGEVAGVMGIATKATGGFDQKGRRQAEQLFTQAFSAGIDKSRAGEHLQAAGQLLQAGGSVTAGATRMDSTALLTMLSRTGMAGFQGARGGRVVGAIDQTIKSAGQINVDGNTKKTMILQALGYGTAGGDRRSYFDVISRAQQGTNLLSNVQDFAKYTAAAGGGYKSQESAYMLSGMSGLSMDLSGKFLEAMGRGATDEELQSILEENKPVQDQILDNVKQLKRIARLEDRMVEIGSSAAKDLEGIQDLLLEGVDFILPGALKALQGIHTVLKNIAEWVKGIGNSMGLNVDSQALAANKAITESEANVFQFAARASKNKMSKSEAARRIGEEIQSAQQAIARSREESVAAATTRTILEGRVPGLRRSRVMGYVTDAGTIGRMRGAQASVRRGISGQDATNVGEYFAAKARVSQLERIGTVDANVDALGGQAAYQRELQSQEQLVQRWASILGPAIVSAIENRPSTGDSARTRSETGRADSGR